jgi:predicted TIM-barrel fold metal-dependent hydrolase
MTPISSRIRTCACCGLEVLTSRREFLGAAAANVVLASGTLRALAAGHDGIVDVHHHMVPPFWFDEVKDIIAAQGGGRIIPNWFGWSPQKAIAEMDKHGVAAAILSMSTPGIWFGNVEQARRLARQCNDYAAQMARDFPGRFGLFAALPLPDTQGSLAELDYAFDTLKADGVGLLTSYGDKWLGDPAYDRVFEALNRRQAVVYVHPATPTCCTKLMPHVPPFLTEFIQETNRAITSLMYSGTLSKYRDIKFIFSHAGGAIPTLAGRIAQLGSSPQLASKVPEGVEAVLRRQYYEIANSASLPAMAALTSIIPLSQILFGSDFPLVPLPATVDGLAALKMSATDLQAISRENALRLLPRLKQ